MLYDYNKAQGIQTQEVILHSMRQHQAAMESWYSQDISWGTSATVQVSKVSSHDSKPKKNTKKDNTELLD